MRELILCADDFAQSPGISSGILALSAQGRLSASSVFSLAPCWRQFAKELAQQPIDIGLHIDLTEPFAQGPRPLGYWLAASQLRLLSRRKLAQRILQQIDAFSDALGRLPDYLDGHQHVHALPVVRAALTDAIPQRWPSSARPYIRRADCLADAGDSGFKARVLSYCMAGFSQHLHTQGLTGPGWFAGLYSLSPQADFPGLMRHWLAQAPEQALIMCHPGHGDSARDPLQATRPREYRYLASQAFADDCARAGVRLARYRVRPKTLPTAQ